MSVPKQIARALFVSAIIIVAFVFWATEIQGQELPLAIEAPVAQPASTWDMFTDKLSDFALIFACLILAPGIIALWLSYKSTKLQLKMAEHERDRYAAALELEKLGIRDTPTLRVVDDSRPFQTSQSN